LRAKKHLLVVKDTQLASLAQNNYLSLVALMGVSGLTTFASWTLES